MKKHRLMALIVLLALLLSSCSLLYEPSPTVTAPSVSSLTPLPEYQGSPFVKVNGNQPFFEQSELSRESFEQYAPLDSLGRCGVALACIGQNLMPTEERGSIGQIKPSGWQTVKYDCVDGKYLYNRCHLIGFQLTGENANVSNLITGTRYLNVEGMLPFENMVADYVEETGNHVMYRVTPVFVGTEAVARGVLMEALSVEDKGEGIRFCVYCFNVQPQVSIDYRNGESRLSSEEIKTEEEKSSSDDEKIYILNTSSKRIHLPECASVSQIAPQNKKEHHGDASALLHQGYSPCGSCHPFEE
ncbi:MAG: DNA/RNA non-specific endonuclease [Clostridia bacterium]|nr:DNA/RNA non-specific endonuclease [Clostridia bacterium]